MRTKDRASIDANGTTWNAPETAPGKRALTDSLVQRSAAPTSTAAAPLGRTPPMALVPDQSFLDSIIGATQAPVQQQAEAPAETADVHGLAAAGIGGSSESLPFLDVIQASFGSHDVSGVQAHTDDQAASAAAGMGASAFATGDHVAFAGSPDLHTAAHEAAHVVQQRAGVQLKGGVGTVGDAYEQNADAVADAVVRGESAEALLGTHDERASTRSAGVQRQAAQPQAKAISYEQAALRIDGMTAMVQGGIAGLSAARRASDTQPMRAAAQVLKDATDTLEEIAHSILAQHQDSPDDPAALKANAAIDLVEHARGLANHTLRQLENMDVAMEHTAELRAGSPKPRSAEEVRARARKVANLGICDDKDIQETDVCPLDSNARNAARAMISDTLLLAASHWSDAIQDKHLEILQENSEGWSPVVDILISFAFGKLTGFVQAAGKSADGTKTDSATIDSDGVGGISAGKAIKDISKELIGAGKGEMVSNLKKSTGDRDKDGKVSFLTLIRPVVDRWALAVKQSAKQLDDADLIRLAEEVIALRETFTVEAFQRQIDATLERFKDQVLSIGQGSHLAGTQLAWLFHPRTGERRMALVSRGTTEVKYRHEMYTANSGEWIFNGWIDDDMGHPAIDRSYANKREVLDLEPPGGTTIWTNPEAKELTRWLNGK